MLKEDIQYLQTINKETLELEIFEKKGQEIISGKLYTKKDSWPIIKGVPRMLNKELLESIVVPAYPEFFNKYGSKFKLKHTKKDSLKIKTAKSFAFEWNKYKKIINVFEKDTERYFLDFIKYSELKEKVIADIGCGLAKHGYFISKHAKKYIGIDLSNAVDSAYANTKKNKTLIIQADIYNMPINQDKIDFYYSIGVLHHLPDPYKGFESITKKMKQGSQILIWVYGREGNKRAIYFYNPIRLITTRMNKTLLHALCHVPASIVHVLNLITKMFHSIGLKKIGDKIPLSYYANFPYDFKVNDSFDIFATPKQEYYYKKDIEQWFKKAKIKKFEIKNDKYQGLKGFGTK